MRSSGRRRPRLTRSSSTVRQASVLSPPICLIARRTFWPSWRTPRTTSSEMDVALRSSRTRTTVPSRINRTIGSSARAAIPRVPVALHLAPDPAHDILADRSTKQRAQCAAHTARIGACQISARDQRVGSQRAALISAQGLALPFRRLAVGGVQASTRHGDLGLAEGPHQRADPAAMPMAGSTRNNVSALRRRHAPSIAPARQNGVKFATNHLFNQLANTVTDPRFNWVKPIVEKVGVTLGRQLRKFWLRGNACHGVVSCLAL